jgi:Ca2+-binding RTX toxin-like protein
MAITRVSAAQIVQTLTVGTSFSPDFEGYALQLLDTGRMAAVWKTVTGGIATMNVSTLDPLGVTHTAISALDAAGSTRTLSLPALASTSAGGFFAVWEDDASTVTPLAGDTWGRAYSAAGAAVTAKGALSIAAGGGEYTPSVAHLGNGNILVSWADTLNTGAIPPSGEILSRIYSPAGVALGSEFQMNTTTAGVQFGTDSLAMGDGRSLVVWGNAIVSGFTLAATELRGRFVSAAGAGTGTDFQIDTIAAGSKYRDESLEVLGLGNGGFVTIWEEESNASVEQIHFQRMSAAGVKVGAEVIVESVTGNNDATQLITTELANGGFAVAWRLYDSGTGAVSSHVRSFSYSGAEIGTDTSLNSVAAPGLTTTADLELMANGKVMALGLSGGNIATQVFDFGDERLLGTGLADTLYGKTGVNDVILGGAGNDVINGLGGNDVINGEAGNDTLTGGAGSDTFLFNTAPSATANVDTITDFNVVADTIQLENAVFTGLGTATGVLALAKFYAGAAAHDADDRIIYNNLTGALMYDADGNGTGAAIKFATLTGKPVLTNADFVVV